MAAATGELGEDDYNGDDEEDDHPEREAVAVVVLVLGELARAKVHDDVDGLVDATIVVPLLEFGNHLPFDDVLGRGIGDIFLHAVARADVDLSFLAALFGLDEDDGTIAFFFLPHAPAVADFSGIFFNGVALQVVDEQDEDLGRGAVVIGHQFVLKRVDLRCRQGACVVVHQTRWVGWARQLCLQRRAEAKQRDKDAEEQRKSIFVSCFHRRCHRGFLKKVINLAY